MIGARTVRNVPIVAVLDLMAMPGVAASVQCAQEPEMSSTRGRAAGARRVAQKGTKSMSGAAARASDVRRREKPLMIRLTTGLATAVSA